MYLRIPSHPPLVLLLLSPIVVTGRRTRQDPHRAFPIHEQEKQRIVHHDKTMLYWIGIQPPRKYEPWVRLVWAVVINASTKRKSTNVSRVGNKRDRRCLYRWYGNCVHHGNKRKTTVLRLPRKLVSCWPRRVIRMMTISDNTSGDIPNGIICMDRHRLLVS